MNAPFLIALSSKITLGSLVHDTRSALWLQMQGTYATARMGFWIRHPKPWTRTLFKRRAFGHTDSWQLNFWRFSLAVHWETSVWHEIPSHLIPPHLQAQMKAVSAAAQQLSQAAKAATTAASGLKVAITDL